MWEIIWDVFVDALLDSVKMLPFLFGAYLLIEYIEHRASHRIQRILAGSGKYGPLGGALLGCVPQCGFSVTAANLYGGRIITLGTLIAVFLSTSDEAIPVLLGSPGSGPVIFKLLACKVVIAIVAGFCVDGALRLRKRSVPLNTAHVHDLCSDCDCEHSGIVVSALKHTIHIFLFIFLVSLVLGGAIAALGEERLSALLLTGSVLQPLVAALIGFIPNCAASVVLTELFLAGSISFGAAVAGLCAGAGVGMAVLFKVNRNTRENLGIAALLYVISAGAGMLITLLG